MVESCVTCKSFVNLSTIQQNEWNILTYLFHPFHKKILPVIRKDQSVQICDKCQSSISCIEKFRIFALENFSGWLVKRSPQTSSITQKKQVAVDPQKINNIAMKRELAKIGDNEENGTFNKRTIKMELTDDIVSLSYNNNTGFGKENESSSRAIKKELVDDVPEIESIGNEEIPQMLANINDQMPQMAQLNTGEVGRTETQKKVLNGEIQNYHTECTPAKKRRKRMPKIVSSYQVEYRSQVTKIVPKVPIPRIMPKIQVPHIVTNLNNSRITELNGPCLTVVPANPNHFATGSGHTVPVTAVLLQKPNSTMYSETTERQPDSKKVTHYIRFAPEIAQNQCVLVKSSAKTTPRSLNRSLLNKGPIAGYGVEERVYERVNSKAASLAS